MSGPTVIVKYSYHWLPVYSDDRRINSSYRFYLSPTLRQLELSKARIALRLDKALRQNHIAADQKNAIMTQLNRINQGGIVLNSQIAQDPQIAIMEFLKNLISKMNQAGLPLPQDLPGGEFQAWFAPNVLGSDAQRQAQHKELLKQSHCHFVVENYKMSRIEKALSLVSFIASWSSSIVAGLGVAVMCVNPPAAMYMFAASFLLFHSDESDEKRWARAGLYVRRVWDGAYYDVKHTFFKKSLQRLALLGAMIMPVIALTVSGMTVQGMLRAAFQMASRIGLAWMLVSPMGQLTASVIFVCLAVTRALKALDYDLKNSVVPELIAGIAGGLTWWRDAATQEANRKSIYKRCEAYGLSFNLKQTEPAAEHVEYVLPAFNGHAQLNFSCESRGTAGTFRDQTFTFCESESGPYLKRGAA